MPAPNSAAARQLRKEAILFGVLLLCGLVLLPIAIYLVGTSVFGDYGDGSLTDFFATLYGRLWIADPAALYLVLAPYLIWQTLRVSWAAFRWRRPAHGSETGDQSA